MERFKWNKYWYTQYHHTTKSYQKISNNKTHDPNNNITCNRNQSINVDIPTKRDINKPFDNKNINANIYTKFYANIYSDSKQVKVDIPIILNTDIPSNSKNINVDIPSKINTHIPSYPNDVNINIHLIMVTRLWRMWSMRLKKYWDTLKGNS